MRVLLVAAGVALLATVTGCARTHLFYDTRELRHQPIQAQQKAGLLKEVEGKVGDRAVTWVAPDGRERSIARGHLKDLGTAELGALWLATSTGEVGGESDVRVHVAGKGSTPVSVLIALDGSIRVVSPPRAPPPPEAPAPTVAALRQRFHIEHKMPGKWRPFELSALAESLALLSPEEQAVLRTVTFDRSAGNPDPNRAALYQLRACSAVIYLFSTGAQSNRFRFVGDTNAPRSAVLHSIIHEMGHAFEKSLAREKYCAAEHARGAAANKLIGEGNALGDDNPILAAYEQALAGEPAPTDYGNTSPHESFAESFALFHVDPAALKRARPGVYAWFAAGGHIKASR